ncbi:MAG: Arc family DNA binding domain-containing protein [Coriobacteriales bacterium]|jgi:hypothetical protein|nr:Arc family DNA binding domain-containing protein [Coriobacteriales bacterium]
MAQKKQYPLRIDSRLWQALEKWAADDLRSVNAQMEFIVRKALRDAGRLPKEQEEGGAS